METRNAEKYGLTVANWQQKKRQSVMDCRSF